MASKKRSATDAFDDSTLASSSNPSPSSEEAAKKVHLVESKEPSKKEDEKKILIKDFYDKKIIIGVIGAIGKTETKGKDKEDDDEKKDSFSYLWSLHEDERVFERKDGTEFKIKACRTADTEAILFRGPTNMRGDYDWTTKITEHTVVTKLTYLNYGLETKEADPPLVFRTVEEVIDYLRKNAHIVEVNRDELNPWNYERHEKMKLTEEAKEVECKKYGEYVPSDDILWNLFVETTIEKRQEYSNLHKAMALPMAREFLLADRGLLKIADDLIKVVDATEGKVIDDHGGSIPGRRILKDTSPITLMRKEYRLAPGVIGAYPVTRTATSVSDECHGMPAVKIGRRTKSIHYQAHDDAWICGFRTCGNPYYVGDDGFVHISTWATGQGLVPIVSKPPFCGRADISHWSHSKNHGTGYGVQAQVSITVGELRSLIKEIKAQVFYE